MIVLQGKEDNTNDYRFYRYEEVEEKWLSPSTLLKPGTLCWVLRGRRSKAKNSSQQQQRNILFQRAVVETTAQDDNHKDNDPQDRILVRYPMGSTYRVRHVNLWPILRETSLVVCLAETLMYRRWALASTQANDAFVEIGCDAGILVHRVHGHSDCPDQVWGLDTCRASIVQAQKRFPTCHFRQWRVPLEGQQQPQPPETTQDQQSENQSDDDDKANNDQEEEDDNQLLESKRSRRLLPDDLFPNTKDDTPQGSNLVVAVDINGNRELTVVQQCIQIVIQEWKPRLIIVKSETLYQELARRRNEGIA